MPHQIHRKFLFVAAQSQIGERHRFPVFLDEHDGKFFQIVFIKESQRKPFFPGIFVGQPLIGDRFEFRHQRRHFGGRQNLKNVSLLFVVLPAVKTLFRGV